LHDFLVAAARQDAFLGLLFRTVVLGWLDVLDQAFGAGTLAYSPALPLLPVSDDEIETAFVAATAEASNRALSDPMQAIFREWLGPRRSDATTRARVHAGRLFYARVRRDGTVERERVADGLWCATVSLRRHPATGRPLILAIGLPSLVGPSPRATLMLFERQGLEDWLVQTVSAGSPTFDADFAILPDGTPFVVASEWDSETTLPHLTIFRPEGRRWRASPLNWRAVSESSEAEPPDPEARDVGALPRIVSDAEGGVFVGFITPVVRSRRGTVDFGRTFRWMLAILDRGGWRARGIEGATIGGLTSDRSPGGDDAFELGVIGQSTRGAVAFAPALAIDATGRVHYAIGDGVLRLTVIDPGTLAVRRTSVDVDRRIGFAPSLALNRNGAPAIAYKDDFGPEDTSPAARDDLSFFALEAGNVIPNLDPDVGRRLPLSPSYTVRSAFTFGFAPYQAITSDRLLTPNDFSRELIVELVLFLPFVGAEALIQGVIDDLVERKRPEELLESIVRHHRMHVETVSGGPERIVWGVHWQFFRSHPELNAMIDGLRNRPGILQFTVDNSEHEDEDVERIDVTFIDPLAVVDGGYAASLDMEQFPSALRTELVSLGFSMSPLTQISVQRILARDERREDPGREWIVTDPDPFGARQLWFPHIEDPAEEDTRVPVSMRYTVRRRGDGRLEFTIDPLLTVTDRARFRDRDGRFAPCRVGQFWWDLFGRALAADFRSIVPNIAGGIPSANRVRIGDARISSVAPLAHPDGQQGAIEFTLTVGSIWARGVDPDHFDAEFIARATEASDFKIRFSPYVNRDHHIRWWAHRVQSHIGNLEVDLVNWGSLDFLRAIASFVPLLGGLGIAIADEVLGDMAADRADDDLDPDAGSLVNYLLDRFSRFVETRLPVGPPFEAAFLDDWTLFLWLRRPVEEDVPLTIFNVLPRAFDFGLVTIGQQPPPRRNVLVTNDGALPVAIEQVRFEQPTSEFRIVAPQAWPRILLPGDSEIVTVEFVPGGAPGDRRNVLRLRVNGADVDPPVQLGALVIGARRIIARVDPEVLNFGVVGIGQSRIRIARVFSEGDADLNVTGYDIEGPAGVASMFSVSGSPIQLPPGLGISVVVTYTPDGGVPSPHYATFRVHSNDTEQLVRGIALVGRTAPAALLVQPTQIAFNPSPLAGALPPGLGSTREITIYNTGTTSLTLTAESFEIVTPLGSASPHFILAEAGTFPPSPLAATEHVLQAGAFLTVIVVFRPASIGMHGGTMRIGTTDPTVPVVTVQISGEGIGG
jgi:hypothetical protein